MKGTIVFGLLSVVCASSAFAWDETGVVKALYYFSQHGDEAGTESTLVNGALAKFGNETGRVALAKEATDYKSLKFKADDGILQESTTKPGAGVRTQEVRVIGVRADGTETDVRTVGVRCVLQSRGFSYQVMGGPITGAHSTQCFVDRVD
jgi:hypothetical protein